VGHEPLHCRGPRVKKTALDEALHAHVGNVTTTPWEAGMEERELCRRRRSESEKP
jgi:hypothetical protein